MAKTFHKGENHFEGSCYFRITNVAFADSPYTVTDTDYYLEVDTSGGAVTVNLPKLADSKKNGRARVLGFKVVDGSSAVTIDGNAAEAIDGSATLSLSADNDAEWLIAGTADWQRQNNPPALNAADIPDDTIDSQHYAALSIDAEHLAADIVDETKLNMSTNFVIPLPFTLANRGGPNSDGVQIGTLTHTAIGDCTVEDNSGATFVDETTDVNSAAANDVAILTPFDTNDAIYFGYASAPFCALAVTVGTAGAGDAVAGETLWEYSQGSGVWASLEAASFELTDDSAALTAGTAKYVVSFIPPSDWATQAVDGGTAMYFIRLRATADNVYNTTTPLITQAWVVPLDVGQGMVCPYAGTVSAVDMMASVASATNDDTELLLVNVTQGTSTQITWTGADTMDRVTGLTTAVAAGDGLALVTIQEDGTTEFADGFLSLQIDY